MMNIGMTDNKGIITVTLEGRLDTTTAPQLEEVLKGIIPEATQLTLDFCSLEFISSAGLRVLLSAHKVMSKQGGMVVRRVNETVKEVFDITGFSNILTIEDGNECCH